MGGKGFELVGCSHEGQIGDIGHMRRDHGPPTLRRVQPRANRRATLCQLVYMRQG